MEWVPLLGSGQSGRSVVQRDVEQRGKKGVGGAGAALHGGVGIGGEPTLHMDR